MITTISQKYLISETYQNLFQDFESENISWCHWKSNEHIGPALSGETDLDILFDPRDQILVEKIMLKNGFLKFKNANYKTYPGIYDFITIDKNTGNVLHAHSHFHLTLGEKNLKSYIFPFVENIIDSRVVHEDYNIAYSSDPHDEIILLILRYALKISQNTKSLPKDFSNEFDWLLSRVKIKQVQKRSEALFNKEISHLILAVIESDLKIASLMACKKSIISYAQDHKFCRYKSFSRYGHYIIRNSVSLYNRISQKIGLHPLGIVQSRVMDKGCIVALLGVDGSGKSTISNDIVSNFSKKMDVKYVYMGSGNGPQIFIIRFLKTIKSYISSHKDKEERKKKISSKSQNLCWSQVIFNVLNVWHKNRMVKKCLCLRKKGYLVICDRWPQNKFNGMNDGPMLSALAGSSNFVKKRLYQWEKEKFEFFNSVDIDQKIYLETSIENSMQRKKSENQNKEFILQKIYSLSKLYDDKKDIRISTDQSLENVTLKCKNQIWSQVQDNNKNITKLYECIGLPASGKTTLSNNIIEKYKYYSRNDILAEANLKSNYQAFGLSIYKYIFLYLNVFMLILKYRLFRSKKSLTYLLKIPTQLIKFESVRKEGIIWADQLFLQNIWSAFVSSSIKAVNPLDLVGLISTIYKGIDTSVIYLDTPISDVCEQLENRTEGGSDFDNLDLNHNYQIFKDSYIFQDFEKSCLYAGVPVLKDRSSDIEEIIARSENLAL